MTDPDGRRYEAMPGTSFLDDDSRTAAEVAHEVRSLRAKRATTDLTTEEDERLARDQTWLANFAPDHLPPDEGSYEPNPE